jgi:hypothetical protein
MFASYALLGLVFLLSLRPAMLWYYQGMLRRFKNTTMLVPLVSVVAYRSAFSAKSGHGEKPDK